MRVPLLNLLILFLLLSACGQKEKSKPARKEQNISREEMESLISSQVIFCQDNDFCPQGLGRMFSINFDDNKKSSMCAAVLIDEDLVMTNSHCIWAGDIGLEKTCEGLYFAFPTPTGNSIRAFCSSIIWRDKRTNGRTTYRQGDNDFALIKLDRKLPLTPMKLVNGGLTPGQTVYPLVTDHLSRLHARITKLECKVERIDTRGVATLKDCPIISGNSGSAIVDKDLHVVGIIFSSTNNNVRKPTDNIEVRTKSNSKGFAYTIDHLRSVLNEKLPQEEQEVSTDLSFLSI